MRNNLISVNDEERAALDILRSLKLGPLSAALIAREALRAAKGSESRALRCISLGLDALRDSEKSVSFARAVDAALDARKDRRSRTLSDFRYFAKRFMARCPGLASRRIRSLSPRDCRALILRAFDTPRQQFKAHAILSGIFKTALQRGWCSANPMYNVEKPRVQEKELPILSREEIERLLLASRRYEQGICLPAVGFMLYAGLRPHEVTRLRGEDVSLAHGSISIRPQHSKTGGARRVTILPPLRRLLQAHAAAHAHEGRICPPSWQRHWSELHKAAGLSPWRQDVLRHTFASHHLARFRSYAALQVEMGHRSAELLRTRYVSMPQEASLF